MQKKKTLRELTIKDNFMFGVVMAEPELCKQFLEIALEKSIERVIVSKEKSLVYHPAYRGVRLDVYAKDETNAHYNIEMQVVRKPALGNRSRYYQSQLDMELLLSGNDYADIPNTYVIFICDFDPFGQKKYRYTFQNLCLESSESSLQDGRKILFLSTKGENEEEVPKELVTFLNFVEADLEQCERDFEDAYVKKLQKFILHVKGNREMEERFMILEEMLKEERAEGMAQGERTSRIDTLLEILQELGSISEHLQEQIKNEKDIEVLKSWIKIAIKSKSIEEFTKKIQ